MDELVSTGEAAKHLNVTRQTIRNWVLTRRIKAVRLPSGVLRIPRAEIERILMTGEHGGE
jgi:excisionase family DNA binding protein